MTSINLSYDDIPFDDLPYNYIFAVSKKFKSKYRIRGEIYATYINSSNLAKNEVYTEWTTGEKAYIVKEENQYHVKSNFELSISPLSDAPNNQNQV